MHEFDRILQRDDVDSLMSVDLIEERRQRRRLAAAGGAGHQDQPGFFLRDLFENRGQAQALHARDFAFELSQNDREMSLLPENVHAKAGFVPERITAVAGAAREIIVNQPAISLHEREGDLFRLIRRQRFDWRVHEDRLQFAKIFHLHRVAHGKIQIRDAFVGFQHRG